MPQRTIAEATDALENLAGLSDADRRRCQAEITTAQGQARRSAEELMDSRVAEVAAERDEALTELCAVRDAYADLVREAQLGRITAAECDRRLNALRARQRSAERLITRTSEALAFVENVEADPIAYGDSLFAKFPLIRPDFTF